MRKKGNDLEKESNNLSIIVVLALFLICSLGYIAYDKYFSSFGNEPNEAKEITTDTKEMAKSTTKKIAYNKDGIFIKKLMKKAVIHTGFGHAEYALYEKDKVMATELEEGYKNQLIVNNISGTGFSTTALEESSIEIFGKNIYTSYPQTFEVICARYNLINNYYYKDNESGGCGGSRFKYLETIDKIDSDDDHIYVYNKVGFSCPKGVCVGLQLNESNTYDYDKVIKEINESAYNEEIDLNAIKDKLDTYKFTFTYDKDNNIYYFESVEKEN